MMVKTKDDFVIIIFRAKNSSWRNLTTVQGEGEVFTRIIDVGMQVRGEERGSEW